MVSVTVDRYPHQTRDFARTVAERWRLARELGDSARQHPPDEPNVSSAVDLRNALHRLARWANETADWAASISHTSGVPVSQHAPADGTNALGFALRALVAELRLKGNEAGVVLAICDGNGGAAIRSLAVRFEWENPTDNWNSTRKRLNRKFKGCGWPLRRPCAGTHKPASVRVVLLANSPDAACVCAQVPRVALTALDGRC